MADEVSNLILEHLRRLRDGVEHIRADVQDLKLRVTAIEEHLGQVQVQLAGQNRRFDRIEERLGRIERRLDLVEA